MDTEQAIWIGVDAGTSGCKAVAVDDRGAVLASDIVAYATERGTDGRVTQDARDWLTALSSTVRSVARTVQPGRVCGMSVTAPAHNAVLVDASGEPVRPVLLWSDARPAPLAEHLRKRYGEAFFKRTLVRLGPAWTLPQLAWLLREDPSAWRSVRHVLVGKDYLRHALTGRAATDPSDAAGTALYDPRAGRWLEDVCADIGLDPALLPDIQSAEDLGGKLSEHWAKELGLPLGLPVAVGATDTAAELVSVGAVAAGEALVKIASTGTVVGVSDAPVADPRLMCYPHAVSGRWYTIAATNTAGTAYGWLRRIIDSSEAGLPWLEREAAAVPPGAEGLLFLPFLEGERTPYWDSDLRAAFIGLSSAHSRTHCARAALEGVAFALRSCRDVMKDAGVGIENPALTGGGLRSPLWRSVLLAVLGCPGRVVEPSGPAVGAAMLAAQAAGSPIEATDGSVTTEHPCVTWQETYETMYSLFAQGVEATSELSRQLVGLTRHTRSQQTGGRTGAL